MKHAFQLMSILLLSATLAACGGGSSSSNSGSSSSSCAGGSSASSGSASVTSLTYVDTTVGTGATLAAGQNPSLTFTGWLYNSANPPTNEGTVFQSTATNSGTAIGVGSFITGFDQGVLGMKVGGTRILTIPASLAYGACAPMNSGIPPNSAVIFSVTLNSIAS